MLLECKKSKIPLSKNDLANLTLSNHNSIQTWRKSYFEGGITALMALNLVKLAGQIPFCLLRNYLKIAIYPCRIYKRHVLLFQ
jgi:hypothetical protein